MPERILFYDCSAGISGDMHLGALVDLGVPPAHLEDELRKLALPGWRLQFTRDARKGIGGTRADVLLDATPAPAAGGAAEFTPVTPTRAPFQAGAEPHEHRNHRDIVALIERSGLPAATRRRALDIFARLAEAEAKIHGVPVAEVGFHEVGAVDSIIDIVGAAIGLEWLQPDRIVVSTIELGGGFVRCAHGRLPVPAPATAELLRGAPVRLGTVPFEATTPTGAAILAASANSYGDTADFAIERIGYGIGHKDGPVPNLLRLFLGTAPAVAAPETAVVLECNLDDMTGETAGYVLEKLLAAGASDAWLTPIVMKKSRPALTLSVLCPPAQEAALADLVLRETTTFGLRRRAVGKLALERTLEEVATSLGPVRVKTAYLDGRPLKSKPEHDDLRRLAEAHHLPLREVERRLLAELAQREAKP